MDAVSGLSGMIGSPAAQAKAKADARREEQEQLMAEIREKGFLAYAEDIEKKKLEELRKKILESMGLTEDALAKMPVDQRAAIEKAIALEIQRRLEASHMAENDPEAGGTAESGLQPGFARLDTSLIQLLQEDRTAETAKKEEDLAA